MLRKTSGQSPVSLARIVLELGLAVSLLKTVRLQNLAQDGGVRRPSKALHPVGHYPACLAQVCGRPTPGSHPATPDDSVCHPPADTNSLQCYCTHDDAVQHHTVRARHATDHAEQAAAAHQPAETPVV